MIIVVFWSLVILAGYYSIINVVLAFGLFVGIIFINSIFFSLISWFGSLKFGFYRLLMSFRMIIRIICFWKLLILLINLIFCVKVIRNNLLSAWFCLSQIQICSYIFTVIFKYLSFHAQLLIFFIILFLEFRCSN